MSLKNFLLPRLTQRFLSQERCARLRQRAEQRRLRAGRAHEVLYFHQADDPYSALAAACLPALLARYDITLAAHIVSPPADAAAPERARLVAWSRRDAQQLARHHGLQFEDHGAQPDAASLVRATAELVAAIDDGQFTELAGTLCAQLWQAAGRDAAPLHESSLRSAAPDAVTRHLQQADTLRKKLGHYLGATFYYAGEWYWGIDRLHYLETRLQELGAARSASAAPLFAAPTEPLVYPQREQVAPVDFFFSLRSPYSAIVAPRVFEMGRRSGAEIRLRYVLPMVMRGLPVPREKRLYISRDTAREAWRTGVPFGRLCDPVGRPVERGLALMPLAEQAGLGEAYLLSFMRGVWAEGIDAGTDRGLRKIVERAGLDWQQALAALPQQAWRAVAEKNRADLLALGLWGVPSFQAGATSAWGQDRLWVIADALQKN